MNIDFQIGLQLALQIFTFIFLVVGGLILRSYLPSYFSEKGKNLATREDIEELTDKVERVRTAYLAQLESLKGELAEVSKEREQYIDEQKSSLLAFYDAAVEIYFEKLATNFGDMPMDFGVSLIQHQESFYSLVSELVKGFQRIVLFCKADDLVRIEAQRVLINVLDASKVMRRKFGAVKFGIIYESVAHKSGNLEEYHDAVERANEASEDYWRQMSPILHELRRSLGSYTDALTAFLKPQDFSSVSSVIFDRESNDT